MFNTNPILDWPMIISTADIENDYYMTFGALVMLFGGLILPWFIAEPVLTFLATEIIPS